MPRAKLNVLLINAVQFTILAYFLFLGHLQFSIIPMQKNYIRDILLDKHCAGLYLPGQALGWVIFYGLEVMYSLGHEILWAIFPGIITILCYIGYIS